MNDIYYYSKAFPATTYPAQRKIFDFDIDDFQKALDTIFRLADSNSENKQFLKPMNILVAKTQDEFWFGINFDKAILNMTAISGVMNKLNNENAEKIMQNLANEQLGFDINAFIKVDSDIFYTAFQSLINNFNIYNDFVNHKTQLIKVKISKEENECVKAFLEGISKNNSTYGGNGMWVDPIFKAKDLTVDPNMCFCVLPFSKKRLEIFDEVIKPTLENKFNITVVRSGNIFKPNLNIMESIWTYINQAAFIIVDLSDRNPNVFYELGICHTLGKPVITLCDEESYKNDYEEKLPFDVNSINTIFYKNTGAGPTKLVNEITKNVTALKSGKPYIE